MKHYFLKSLRLRLCAFVALVLCGAGMAWGEDVTSTINFGNGKNGTISINSASITGADNLNNIWTVTTVGTTSFTPNASYSQVGSSDRPATSITFTTTLPTLKYISSFSAKFGGYNNTAGTVELKIGNTTVGSGNLNGTNDVTINASSNLHVAGTVLTINVTGIAKGVKVYYITYTYDNSTEVVTHTATFSINGNTDQTIEVAEGSPITFPANPSDIYGKTFVGWTTTEINGVQNNAPEIVTEATMGNTNTTYYAVFAEENISEQEFTKTYGFENTEVDESYWVIGGPQKASGQHKTGSYSGKINSNNTYVTFKNKVNVTEFSFEFMRATTNNNYNVYIETSTDNTSWTAIETYEMSSFTKNQWHKKSHSFDGNSALYVRFHCYNTNAERYVDDVTIKYIENITTYSSYCTIVPTTATFTISENCYDVVNNANIYYGTYSNASAFVVPEGLTVHTVSVSDGVLSVADYTSGAIVPANTGVMVSSATAGEKTINLTTATATVDTEGNMLRPTGSGITYRQMATADANCKFYYLTMNGSQIGFYRRNDTGAAFDMLVANKAYLAVPEDEVGEIKGFFFNDVVDGIKAVETTETESKAIYNLAGQRVSKMQKGIYIVNGKKVLVK
jgi:uncharacterized repeat protein (TIGR02543 family)